MNWSLHFWRLHIHVDTFPPSPAAFGVLIGSGYVNVWLFRLTASVHLDNWPR